MLEDGCRVVHAPKAISHTEAPETAKDLFKQRFRWAFGVYQCMWKHKTSFFKGSLGWIGLPNMFVFQLVWPLLSPIGDAVFLYALITGEFQAIVVGYLTFLAMDLIASTIAYKLDDEPVRGMWPILIQRFYYRQFMYIVTFTGIIAAMRGRRHDWNQVSRRNSVPPQSGPFAGKRSVNQDLVIVEAAHDMAAVPAQ